jgi:hypothetical protein
MAPLAASRRFVDNALPALNRGAMINGGPPRIAWW